MVIRSTPMTVGDYCGAWNRKEIRVNRTYQRSGKVWPPAARAYLIESILLDYPIPKLWLHQNYEVQTKTPFKDIVDGQQRTMAIVEFFKGDYAFSTKLETERLRGRKFEQLEEQDQQSFLNYQLDIDLFVSTSLSEVREAFRRMNSYTIPLNDEEKRHAHWQGEFKWFINSLGHKVNPIFLRIGTFTEKQIIRMQDIKLLADIAHAALKGIQTTKKTQLDGIYREYDKAFPEGEWFGPSVAAAIEDVGTLEPLHEGPLMKHYTVYALVLALMHVAKPLPTLTPVINAAKLKRVDAPTLISNLSVLAEALEDPEGHVEYDEFIKATGERNNVRDQRETRFRWMCKALTEKAI